MSTSSNASLLRAVVARLLAYVGPDGGSIATIAGSRVYISQAPDSATFPYLVVRKAASQTSPEYGNLREEFDLEALCYGRPRSSEPDDAEALADLVEQALTTWRESSVADGLTYGQYAFRETEPIESDPINRELVTVRVIVRCVSWPMRLIDAMTAT